MELEKAGADRIHWDVMDGRFVPNLTVGPDVVASVRAHVSLPFEAHLMVLEPQELAPRYVEAGCERILIHAEATPHLHRALGVVRDAGASVVPLGVPDRTWEHASRAHQLRAAGLDAEGIASAIRSLVGEETLSHR